MGFAVKYLIALFTAHAAPVDFLLACPSVALGSVICVSEPFISSLFGRHSSANHTEAFLLPLHIVPFTPLTGTVS